MKVYNDIHEAYLGSLRDVFENPDYVSSPRGMECREKLDYSFRILNPVNTPIQTFDQERNKTIVDYTNKEVELYDSCSNRVEDFVKASKFWGKLANPDGTVNSAYGYLIWKNASHGNPKYSNPDTPAIWGDKAMCTPWQWAKQSLINDKDTRQAILRFSLPEHAWVGVKDFTCTMHAIFFIRDDKLHFSVTMRSNDLMLGLVYDMPWFISLMDKMVSELKGYYPNLTKGHYTHTVHSMHVYSRDKDKVLRMLGE